MKGSMTINVLGKLVTHTSLLWEISKLNIQADKSRDLSGDDKVQDH